MGDLNRTKQKLCLHRRTYSSFWDSVRSPNKISKIWKSTLMQKSDEFGIN